MTKTWWLLALCGVLDAMLAAMNLLMVGAGGTANLVWDMSVVAVAAGACLLAAVLWKAGRDHLWILSLHGLALGAFGVIGLSPLVRGPLSFRPISLLFVVMSLSIGAYALRSTPTLRVAVAAAIAFGVSFVAVGFGYVRLAEPYSFWVWMSSYFAFCALFMLWQARRMEAAR